MVIILENSKFKGCEFYGKLKDDLPNGYGILYFKNKKIIKYVGDWKDGKKNGKGMLNYKDGKTKLDGYWLNDLPNGLVTYYDLHGNKYVCEYTLGKILSGKCYYINKDIYIGYFYKGLKEGYGRLYSSDKIYQGYFENDFKNGMGIIYNLKWKKIYEGLFKNDLYNGFGKLSYSSGMIMYEGYFKENKFHGFGKLYLPDGDIYEGEFFNNRLVSKKFKAISKLNLYIKNE